jgi:hypothetical protein
MVTYADRMFSYCAEIGLVMSPGTELQGRYRGPEASCGGNKG